MIVGGQGRGHELLLDRASTRVLLDRPTGSRLMVVVSTETFEGMRPSELADIVELRCGMMTRGAILMTKARDPSTVTVRIDRIGRMTQKDIRFDPRLEGRCQSFRPKCLPIQILEEFVFFDLFDRIGTQPLTRVSFQESKGDIFGHLTNPSFWKLGRDITLENQTVPHRSIFTKERCPTHAHLKDENTQGPKIDEAGITLFEQDFGSDVFGRPTERLGRRTRTHIQFTQTEITQGDMTGGVE